MLFEFNLALDDDPALLADSSRGCVETMLVDVQGFTVDASPVSCAPATTAWRDMFEVAVIDSTCGDQPTNGTPVWRERSVQG